MGGLHNLLTSWRTNQLMVDKLLDPAMRAHHINLLLLELKLISALPKATAASGASKTVPGSNRGKSFRERLAGKKNLSMLMADTGVAGELESGPVVSFLDLLNKATATKVGDCASLPSHPMCGNSPSSSPFLDTAPGSCAPSEITGDSEGHVDHGCCRAAVVQQHGGMLSGLLDIPSICCQSCSDLMLQKRGSLHLTSAVP